ncbi:MAG: hypothetical protein ABR969_00500 [Sedimentisphaerales bacterium]|jgi:hypothetical protein
MGKIVTKQTGLCFVLGVINLFYVLFISNELDIFAGKFSFKILYLPGLVLGLLILPAMNYFLWNIRNKISQIDYTLIAIPLLLWLLIIPGGSFTNFLFINFPLIWTVSLLYLFRFSNMTKRVNIYVVVSFLWALVAVISFGVNYFIPILPE